MTILNPSELSFRTIDPVCWRARSGGGGGGGEWWLVVSGGGGECTCGYACVLAHFGTCPEEDNNVVKLSLKAGNAKES
jgi:hypothetical protein